MNIIFYIFAILCGAANSIQSGVNAELRKAINNPIFAAIISFSIGLVALILITPFFKEPIPSLASLKSLAWWKWIGGLLGAFFVTTVILIVQRIGSANMIALIVAGQLITAMTLDHFGLIGFKMHPISMWRIIGGIVTVIGVYMIVKN
ncbi:DMT family transporter [Emticicia sp. 17c]|uniref:DMT family transporter n=1 Tax=Emticicia sp. 17c TaxID=3127704 RepID=UPI00301DE060